MARDTPSRLPRHQEERVKQEHAGQPQQLHARKDPGDRAGETLEDLKVALEELRVAQEELRQQNEELASTHVQLDRERQRYQELFEFAPNPYLVTDHFGIILQANRSATQLFGVAPRFLPGKALAAYVASEDRPRFRALLTAIPRDGHPRTVSLQLQPREGAIVEAELTYSVVAHEEESSIRWMARDVTEHERMARQIRALNAELESRVAARTADLTVAHRLAQELVEKEQTARRAAEESEAQS